MDKMKTHLNANGLEISYVSACGNRVFTSIMRYKSSIISTFLKGTP